MDEVNVSYHVDGLVRVNTPLIWAIIAGVAELLELGDQLDSEEYRKRVGRANEVAVIAYTEALELVKKSQPDPS